MTPNRLLRNHRSLLLVALLAFAALVAFPSAAYAHNSLVSSTPAEGETLTDLPEQFSITTSDELLDLGGQGDAFALQVRDSAGLYYGDGCVTVAGTDALTNAAIGAPGDYELIWQVVGEDGHSVSGEIAFTWAPSEEVAPSVGSPTPPECGLDTPLTGEEPPAASANDPSSAIWIGAGLIAVVAAIAALIAAARRRRA